MDAENSNMVCCFVLSFHFYPHKCHIVLINVNHTLKVYGRHQGFGIVVTAAFDTTSRKPWFLCFRSSFWLMPLEGWGQMASCVGPATLQEASMECQVMASV